MFAQGMVQKSVFFTQRRYSVRCTPCTLDPAYGHLMGGGRGVTGPPPTQASETPPAQIHSSLRSMLCMTTCRLIPLQTAGAKPLLAILIW